jgi:hypothetical protein
MDFVYSSFIIDGDNATTNDVDFKEPNINYGYEYHSKGVFYVVGGFFNSLVQKDYLGPYARGDNVDEEMNFDVEMTMMKNKLLLQGFRFLRFGACES